MATRTFSQETNVLSGSSITSSRSRDYKDIDLSFLTNDYGDVYKKIDAAAVKQSLKNLILTDYAEKPFNYYFGSDIRGLLFELFDAGTEGDVQYRIQNAIDNWEPRAQVINITVKALDEENALDIQLTFRVINTTETITLNTTLSRLR